MTFWSFLFCVWLLGACAILISKESREAPRDFIVVAAIWPCS